MKTLAIFKDLHLKIKTMLFGLSATDYSGERSTERQIHYYSVDLGFFSPGFYPQTLPNFLNNKYSTIKAKS